MPTAVQLSTTVQGQKITSQGQNVTSVESSRVDWSRMPTTGELRRRRLQRGWVVGMGVPLSTAESLGFGEDGTVPLPRKRLQFTICTKHPTKYS